jgi:sedoheptulokinase
MNLAGLDIGTTTLCGLLLESDTGEILSVITEPNSFAVQGAGEWESLQDPDAIYGAVRRILDRLAASHGRIGAIGVAGQMHGILYVNGRGNARGPLYTWQDGRGNREMKDGATYAGSLSRLLDRPVSTGMGAVTHYYNTANGLVPADAVTLCTIADYVAMRLARRTQPLMDATNAASLGCFDLRTLQFRLDVVKEIGLDPDMFPRFAASYPALGETEAGTPVFPALGDNQASFLGSVGEIPGSILVNVGTGSQVSAFTDRCLEIPGIDTRPFPMGGYIGVGAALCGGKAYSLLHDFFERTVRLFTGGASGAPWEVMNAVAAQRTAAGGGAVRGTVDAEPLRVDTRFAGTRSAPDARGGISGIDTRNFTPENLITGVREGIADELLGHLDNLPSDVGQSRKTLIGSGNGIRLNPELRTVFENRLGMEMKVPAHREETSYGAALLAGVACGALADLAAAGRLIRYLPR